jgi:hypothetical protein
VLDVVFGLRKRRKPRGGILSDQRKCQKANQDQNDRLIHIARFSSKVAET